MAGKNGQDFIFPEKRLNFVKPEIFIKGKNILTGFSPVRDMQKNKGS